MSTVDHIFELPDFEALKVLQLYLKHMVEGTYLGLHQSPKKGFGIEFKEYRNYAPGDTLKQLDWKYYARTDHYMIKEAETEKQHDFLFVLDSSKSMEFSQANRTKFNLSRTLIASLAYLAQQQHDRYYIFGRQIPRGKFEDFLYHLIRLKTVEDFGVAQMKPANFLSKNATVFIFTDAYSTLEAAQELIRLWSSASPKVIFVHLLYQNEVNLDFQGKDFSFKDLENHRSVQVNTKEALLTYQKKVSSWQDQIKMECIRNRVGYLAVNGTDEPEKYLFDLLKTFNYLMQ